MTDVAHCILLRERIAAHPERLDQGWWVRVANPPRHVPRFEREDAWTCGTTACAAGHSIILAGWRPVLEDTADGLIAGRCYNVQPADNPSDIVVYRKIQEVAREWLGLTTEQAKYLFDGRGTYVSVLAMLDALIAADEGMFKQLMDQIAETP